MENPTPDSAGPKVKLALCVRTADVPTYIAAAQGLVAAPVPDWFLDDIDTYLVDRAVCETDETTLQIIPYMVLKRDDKFFVYTRGDDGAEDRLHGKLSIGIGGHVDSAPAYGETLLSLLRREAAREYREEVGLFISGTPVFTHLLYDPSEAVGRVHLGLSCVLDTPPEGFKLEEGVIERGVWMTHDELLSPAVFMRLEKWSQATATTVLCSEN